jgi:hypothetical protein
MPTCSPHAHLFSSYIGGLYSTWNKIHLPKKEVDELMNVRDMKIVLTIKRLGVSSGSHKYVTDVGYVERKVVIICLVWLLQSLM